MASGVGEAAAVVSEPGLELGATDGAGDDPGTVSASAPAGTSSRPTRPARLSAATATLRPRLAGKTTARGRFTGLLNSLQL